MPGGNCRPKRASRAVRSSAQCATPHQDSQGRVFNGGFRSTGRAQNSIVTRRWRDSSSRAPHGAGPGCVTATETSGSSANSAEWCTPIFRFFPGFPDRPRCAQLHRHSCSSVQSAAPDRGGHDRTHPPTTAHGGYARHMVRGACGAWCAIRAAPPRARSRSAKRESDRERGIP